MLDDAAKLDNDPPETLISPATKFEDASERVKVTVVVSPAFNEEAADVIAIVGDVSSAVVKLRLVLSLIPAYELPAESSKAVSAICT